MLALLVIPVMFAVAPPVAPPAATTPSPATQRELAPRVGNAAAGQLHDKLEAIDAGRDDLGGHATSFRLMPLDMRLPTSFQRVYRVPGDESKLMRGNGALFAVFPQSAYRRANGQDVPQVPPGTVFHIGMPGPSVLDLKPPTSDAALTASSAIDVRVNTRVEPKRVANDLPNAPLVALPFPAENAAKSNESSTKHTMGQRKATALDAQSEDALFPRASEEDAYRALAFGPTRTSSSR
ncbi:MAG: hypothetical protein DWH97_00635 [Planctomycetota bacterium]|nr:MAG: hypothetical protein DWH97_00635 [Planctomycetota bacterium]RLS95657.1 MAG: hypothetical protein DWI12_03800 [Planctomycetota bacterium]